MTNETSAALLYGILPSIREICGKDQQAEKALIQTFLKAEKHAPGEFIYQNYTSLTKVNDDKTWILQCENCILYLIIYHIQKIN